MGRIHLTHVFSVIPSLQKVAYMIASGVICLIYVLCAVVLFFGVRERKGEASISHIKWLHFLTVESTVKTEIFFKCDSTVKWA